MKVLITGAAGLIGSRLATWILDNIPGSVVVGVDDMSGGFKENVDPRVHLTVTKVESDEFSRLMSEFRPDYVYHLAAYAAEGLSPFIRKHNYTNNLLATANVINGCINHNVKRLVFTSSMAVYGVQDPPFDEVLTPAPIDPYGVAKYACEMDIKIAGEQHGLDWCVIRPHNVYGRNQNIWDKYRNVLGIWMYQHLQGKPLTIFGDGLQTRAFSCIDDNLEPMWVAATGEQASKEIINLGGTSEYAIIGAARTLIKIMGGGEIEHLEPRHEVKYAFSTWQKSVDLLGYKETVRLEEGLDDMWSWAKLQPSRPQYVWQLYEVEKGIYSYWK